MRLAVMASGSGTILDAMLQEGIEIALVVVDRPCGATDVAAKHGVAVCDHERTDFTASFDRNTFTEELVGHLEAADIELIAMAGYGTILGQAMYDRFAGKVINTHPALLPSFPGWHGVRDALDYGVKVTGCTVHIATLEVDAGPILAQEAVEVEPDDTESTLHERIKVVERRLYIDTLKDIIAAGRVG